MITGTVWWSRSMTTTWLQSPTKWLNSDTNACRQYLWRPHAPSRPDRPHADRHGPSFSAAAEDAGGDRVAGSGAVTIRRRLRDRVRPGPRRHATERGALYQVEHKQRRRATLARERQRLLRQGRGRTSHLCSRREWSGIGPRPPPVWPRPAGEETSIVRCLKAMTLGFLVRFTGSLRSC